jgi:hypothetical protein
MGTGQEECIDVPPILLSIDEQGRLRTEHARTPAFGLALALRRAGPGVGDHSNPSFAEPEITSSHHNARIYVCNLQLVWHPQLENIEPISTCSAIKYYHACTTTSIPQERFELPMAVQYLITIQVATSKVEYNLDPTS